MYDNKIVKLLRSKGKFTIGFFPFIGKKDNMVVNGRGYLDFKTGLNNKKMLIDTGAQAQKQFKRIELDNLDIGY
jgi:hypothetical protein